MGSDSGSVIYLNINSDVFCRHRECILCMCARNWIYHNYITFWGTLMIELVDIHRALILSNHIYLLGVMLFLENVSMLLPTNKKVQIAAIKYITNKQRFDHPLFWSYVCFSPFFAIFFLFCLCLGDMNVISFKTVLLMRKL